MIRADGILIGSPPAMQAMWCKCIESDSHSAIYTIFMLGTITAMMNLK